MHPTCGGDDLRNRLGIGVVGIAQEADGLEDHEDDGGRHGREVADVGGEVGRRVHECAEEGAVRSSEHDAPQLDATDQSLEMSRTIMINIVIKQKSFANKGNETPR